MKKRLVVILSALVLTFALTACGGSGDGGSDGEAAKIWAGFYQAEVPEGYEVNELETEFVNPELNSQKIMISIRHESAEEAITSKIDLFPDTHERIDDMTVGNYTWLVDVFQWTDGDSCNLFLDMGDGEHSLEINCFGLAIDSPEVTAFMESFALEDDAYNKFLEFANAE